VLVVGLAVATAGCSGFGSVSTTAEGASPITSASPANGATKPSATASPSARTSASPDPSSVEFETDQVSFEYPVGWHTRRGTLNPGGNETIVFVGPSELPSECAESAQGGVCHTWPITTVGPNGALFAWRWFGRPGQQPPVGGDTTTLDGRAATVTKGAANDACAAIGGDESIVITVPPLAGAIGWFQVEACVDGPDRSPGESAFEAMLASASLR